MGHINRQLCLSKKKIQLCKIVLQTQCIVIVIKLKSIPVPVYITVIFYLLSWMKMVFNLVLIHIILLNLQSPSIIWKWAVQIESNPWLIQVLKKLWTKTWSLWIPLNFILKRNLIKNFLILIEKRQDSIILFSAISIAIHYKK